MSSCRFATEGAASSTSDSVSISFEICASDHSLRNEVAYSLFRSVLFTAHHPRWPTVFWCRRTTLTIDPQRVGPTHSDTEKIVDNFAILPRRQRISGGDTSIGSKSPVLFEVPLSQRHAEAAGDGCHRKHQERSTFPQCGSKATCGFAIRMPCPSKTPPVSRVLYWAPALRRCAPPFAPPQVRPAGFTSRNALWCCAAARGAAVPRPALLPRPGRRRCPPSMLALHRGAAPSGCGRLRSRRRPSQQ